MNEHAVTGYTTSLGRLLVQLNVDRSDIREAIIEHTCDRLRNMARRMLRMSPKIHRWAETDDVLQNSLIRLHRSLAEVKPTSARQFYGLAVTQIRRELIDLARKYYGPGGIGANHRTDGEVPVRREADRQPSSLDDWTGFHEQIDQLPKQEKEIIGLLWYEGMTQNKAAQLLDISLATLKRRWQSVRMRIREQMDGERPE